jgi:hypothetical protein
VCAFSLLALIVAAAWAQDEREIFRNLTSQSGTIRLQDGVATLNVGPNFSHLSPAGAAIFLTKIWRYPPGAGERALGPLSGDVSDEDAGRSTTANCSRRCSKRRRRRARSARSRDRAP